MKSKFKYFVLLANMRTGSNLFEQNIRLYEEFSCHGELFNPHFVGYPNVHEAFGVSMSEREKKPQKLINRMLAQETETLPGFRLFADHDHRALSDCLADSDCAKIVLTRNPIDSFVSHLIAVATDQWKLTDISKRKKAKVHFDFVAFRSYLNRLNDYLSNIQKGLQHSGQAAFYLQYNDLNKVETFNGLATYLGGHELRKELQGKIVRQNPEGLEEKVENFEEMKEQLKSLDLLAMKAVPALEPVRNPGSKNFKAGRKAPILLMSLEKGTDPALDVWLQKHEKALSGSDDLETNMNQKQLGDWLASHPDRVSLSVLTHPVERAYAAFYKHIFKGGDDLFPWIRNTLEKNYNVTLPDVGMTKDPNRTVIENSGYGISNHQTAFLKFLRFLKGNLQGQTRARVDQSWASQNSILQGYCRLAFPDVLIRKEHLASEVAKIEERLGLDPVAIDNEMTPGHCFELSEIYSPEIEKAARQVYARDYQMFGFSDWKEA